MHECEHQTRESPRFLSVGSLSLFDATLIPSRNMNQHTSFKDLKARISERGICTNSAIQQMLVAEHIQEMNKRRVEEDTADSTVLLLSQPIKIMSKIRARFSQQRSVIPVPRVPSLSTASTILDDKRFLARAFQRRSEENLQKLVWLRPAATFRNEMTPKTNSRFLQAARSVSRRYDRPVLANSLSRS